MKQAHVEIFRTKKWIDEDCEVKSCLDGVIFTTEGIKKCPCCNRCVPLYGQSLQVASHYLPKWSKYELESRKKDRERVVQDGDFRVARGKQMMSEIVNLLSNPNAKKKKVEDEEPEIYNDQEEIPF